MPQTMVDYGAWIGSLQDERYELRCRVLALEKALQNIATDLPMSECPTIESILNRAQRLAREALAGGEMRP